MIPGIWRANPPGPGEVVAALRSQAPAPLPDSYFALLERSNGGEGDLGVPPGWISFWPAEDVVSLNHEYSVSEFLPGFFAFASNGGGELLAFDLRRGPPHPIAMIPTITLDLQQAVEVAASFDSLVQMMGVEEAGTVTHFRSQVDP